DIVSSIVEVASVARIERQRNARSLTGFVYSPRSRSALIRATKLLLLFVTQHIDDRAVRIAHEEAPYAPWLVGQRIDDRKGLPDSSVMASIDVAHFDTDVGMRLGARGGGDEADLRRRIGARRKGHDPFHVH